MILSARTHSRSFTSAATTPCSISPAKCLERNPAPCCRWSCSLSTTSASISKSTQKLFVDVSDSDDEFGLPYRRLSPSSSDAVDKARREPITKHEKVITHITQHNTTHHKTTTRLQHTETERDRERQTETDRDKEKMTREDEREDESENEGEDKTRQGLTD